MRSSSTSEASDDAQNFLISFYIEEDDEKNKIKSREKGCLRGSPKGSTI